MNLKKRKEKKMVYVLSNNGKRLMPCCSAIGRLLLKQKKAKVKMTMPFTIQLNYETTEHLQDLQLKVDSGSGKSGYAVSNKNNDILYMSEVENRNDVTEKTKARSSSRRGRRNRNTRYRKPRFNNRKNSIKNNRFSPTMRSKFNSIEKEIKLINKIMPITEITIETATFDAHALKNPDVLKDLSLYQKGVNFGFSNTKAYVLNRDGYKCQNSKCKCKEKQPTLHVHHIVFKSNGGSDEADNLTTLCKYCHDDLHKGLFELKLKGKKKGQLKHATQMNSIRVQLLKRFPNAKETFGFITKEYRQLIGLPKEHYFDAVAIGSGGNPVNLKTKEVFIKKCIADGDYQLSKGVRSEQVIPVGKIRGFRKFDRVKYRGEFYFIKGRMSTGYAILMGIDGKKVELKPIPKFSEMKRINARNTWLVDVKNITI